ncbi:hypothetical protein CDAR_366301 [Caerostris darwini]|uniref:Transmembrane protein n=1 Tax=Caerostris darwini TaxID=1538125 RepID=A0AAV4SVF6_9ARAC|nr:hypothetical protein CDAR_366301 [Caerostris darwini]
MKNRKTAISFRSLTHDKSNETCLLTIAEKRRKKKCNPNSSDQFFFRAQRKLFIACQYSLAARTGYLSLLLMLGEVNKRKKSSPKAILNAYLVIRMKISVWGWRKKKCFGFLKKRHTNHQGVAFPIEIIIDSSSFVFFIGVCYPLLNIYFAFEVAVQKF